MEYTYPSYYKKFVCTADACPDTCCAGWGIAIDNTAMKKYKKAVKELGSFGNRLYNSIDWKDASFYHQDEKRCVFLNEKNLCDMVLEAGEDYLCKTCRRYPRHYEEFENLREVLLSLSCPEVAKILFELQEKVTYETVEQERSQVEEYEFFDFLLFTKLQDVRFFLQDVFQNRKVPVGERMAYALAMVHDIQTRIQKNELFGIDAILDKCEKDRSYRYAKEKWARYTNRPTERRYLLHSSFLTFEQLEILNPNYVAWQKKAKNLLYHELTEDAYLEAKAGFEKLHPQLAIIQEQLLVYFLYSYLCGAVYDEDVLSKLKLALVHTTLITELFLAKWLERDGMKSNEPLTTEELVDVAHRYAREIEHSDPNLNAVEKMMKENQEFSFQNLLILSLTGI